MDTIPVLCESVRRGCIVMKMMLTTDKLTNNIQTFDSLHIAVHTNTLGPRNTLSDSLKSQE